LSCYGSSNITAVRTRNVIGASRLYHPYSAYAADHAWNSNNNTATAGAAHLDQYQSRAMM
jgi:hypothetical protein